MALRHNCIQGTFTKPLKSDVGLAELVINQTDGTLWTKDLSGNIIQTSAELVDVDKSWKFIGGDGQSYYGVSFAPTDPANSKVGIGYRFVDSKTLHVSGGVSLTKQISRGYNTICTFGNDIIQRLNGLGHQYGVATLRVSLNAGQYLILNVRGFLDLATSSDVLKSDEVFLDCYFQLN